MDHLAAAPGVHCYANYSTFGEVLGTSTLHPVEWVDVSRQFAPSGHVHYGTAEVGTVHYVQEALADAPLTPQLKLAAAAKPEVQQTAKPAVGEKIACQECGATFACGANLRNHMRIHTGERPYICEECGASFTQRSNLRSHKRVHTGERPYMCGICGQTFARSSHLPGHMRTHTGEKPFDCRQCGRSFATNQIMKNHMRTHTGERPFTCDFCDATFAQSSCLATHRKIHTGERNFKCGECGKAFISRSGLQTHERVHTGEKPYSCVTCDKSFKTSSYLSKHKQKYCGNNGYKNRVQQPEAKKPGRKPGSSKKITVKSKRSSQTSKSVNKIRTKRLRRSRRVKNSDSDEEPHELLEEATFTETNGGTELSSVKKEKTLDMLTTNGNTNSIPVKKENDVQDSRGNVAGPLDTSAATPESCQANTSTQNTQLSRKENADDADGQENVVKMFTNKKCTNSFDLHELHSQIPAGYKEAIAVKDGADMEHVKAIFSDAPTYVMLDQMTLANQSLEGIPDQLLLYHDVFHS